MENETVGLSQWLTSELFPTRQNDARVNLVCERNVLAQVESLADNPFVRDAWGRGQALSIHGWIYSIQDGLLRDLETSIDNIADATGRSGVAPKVTRGRPRRGRAG